MEFKVLTRKSTWGTVPVGNIQLFYKDLVKVFGPPIRILDKKTRVMWVLRIDGIVCTIYDFKEGDIPFWKVVNWQIGGKSVDASRKLYEFLNQWDEAHKLKRRKLSGKGK